VLLLPTFGGVDVDERERDLFFGSAAFGADVADDVADDLVAHDDLVATVFEDEAAAVRSVGVGLESGGVLRVERRRGDESQQKRGGKDLRCMRSAVHRLTQQFRRGI
jgi:hypothetical protein